jgi:crotonobetainyl-CoA:carnitine CoA-transferase CaiB-like acyl-CoA transferase
VHKQESLPLSEVERPARALDNTRVVDMTRVLAGPWATQLLADLGADVIKIERPAAGDDTRSWGPPWFQAQRGQRESAYFVCTNRGKRSLAVDIAEPRGAALVGTLAAEADVFVENFKVGDLKRYGLDYATLAVRNPRLVYCSITGFGQEGPYADLPGYDFIAQAMGGIMSLTGDPNGSPVKTGVALTDIMTGLYACNGILAALAQRERSGRGQHVTTCLLDVQIATLANQASSYLATQRNPPRMGNAHPSIVPYQSFRSADGLIAIGVGNDSQFHQLCRVLDASELTRDGRFTTNAARVEHREALIPLLQSAFMRSSSRHWITQLTNAGVPVGPVNTLADVFADPHVTECRLQMAMPHSHLGSVPGVACPVRLSDSPPRTDLGPPVLDEHGEQIRQRLWQPV